jgi:hypothetical protein
MCPWQGVYLWWTELRVPVCAVVCAFCAWRLALEHPVWIGWRLVMPNQLLLQTTQPQSVLAHFRSGMHFRWSVNDDAMSQRVIGGMPSAWETAMCGPWHEGSTDAQQVKLGSVGWRRGGSPAVGGPLHMPQCQRHHLLRPWLVVCLLRVILWPVDELLSHGTKPQLHRRWDKDRCLVLEGAGLYLWDQKHLLGWMAARPASVPP